MYGDDHEVGARQELDQGHVVVGLLFGLAACCSVPVVHRVPKVVDVERTLRRTEMPGMR